MARSEAIRRVKDNTIRYLAAGETPVMVDPQSNNKALRGLNSVEFGRLLIPAEELGEWDADPELYVHSPVWYGHPLELISRAQHKSYVPCWDQQDMGDRHAGLLV